MIQLIEKFDLAKLYKEIKDDINHQHPDEGQKKDIPQETITELMVENLKRKQKQS